MPSLPSNESVQWMGIPRCNKVNPLTEPYLQEHRRAPSTTIAPQLLPPLVIERRKLTGELRASDASSGSLPDFTGWPRGTRKDGSNSENNDVLLQKGLMGSSRIRDRTVFSMVDSSVNSPDVDPEAYPNLLETIQGLGKGYMSFDENSSNFPRFLGLSIPGIHIPLQSDDSAVWGSQLVQGISSCQTAKADADLEGLAERMAAGAQAGTSTSSGEPLNTSNVGGTNAPPRPPRDVDTIPPLSSGLGPMPYSHFYGDGPGGFTEQFRTKYSIPDGVLVERVTTDRIPFGEDFIMLPLFSITEGGVRFPMSPFLYYFLADYKLAPIQVAVNTWHILCSVIRLAESNNLLLTLGDLMLMYMVSRNPKYDKYYLTTRQHFDHLVDRLYDTEKWGNVLVKVSGNFEWGPINPLLDHPFPTRTGSAVERTYRIPRVRGFPGNGDKPDCSVPNKGLLVTGKWPNLIVLLQCANRDAPTFLDYEPTYAGFAHRKDKSKMSSGARTPCKNQRNPLPPPKSIRFGRRGGRPKGHKKGENIRKRGDLSEADPSDRGEHSEAFLPDFECSDGHVISVDDSLGESPLLAMTLLRGLALPKDMENLPTGKANNMAELCLFLAKAGQCPTKAFSDMEVLLESRRSMRENLQAKRKEADQLSDRIEELEAQIAEAEIVRQERDRLLLQLKDAGEENDRLKREKQQMEEELPKKLKDAGDASYNEAEEYYAEQVQKLVAKAFKEGKLKGINDTHSSSFLHGYQVGLDYAEVPKVPKVDHRREPPVVPPLELLEILPEDLLNPTTDSQPDLTDAVDN
ncbi:hypothetical protein RHSIM_Rhsim04G0192000 [Rhododendron simsii]|uniref:Uncharacterized protein n=1 Tax=Rhododendron simsii TaxID=118357 RepID=A0A834H2M7_RHOSS|nr:hypothetical protein RHSIM_Rhsim04G0192000 [Rhododendron simsii]